MKEDKTKIKFDEKVNKRIMDCVASYDFKTLSIICDELLKNKCTSQKTHSDIEVNRLASLADKGVSLSVTPAKTLNEIYGDKEAVKKIKSRNLRDIQTKNVKAEKYMLNLIQTENYILDFYEGLKLMNEEETNEFFENPQNRVKLYSLLQTLLRTSIILTSELNLDISKELEKA